jgi:type II secretory pathway component GspD/PulD (secretin)
MRQIGPSFSPISEAVLTLKAGTVSQIDHDLNQVIVTLGAPRIHEATSEKRGNLNQLVSLDIESAELSPVIKTLVSEAGFDVDFVSPVVGTVNEKFKDIPLKTALATLLAPGNYDFEVQGNTIRVGLEATLVASKAIMPHITEIISPGGGMGLDQFSQLVKAILDPANAVKVTSDTTRNVLILNGTPSDIAGYKRAIKDLKLDEANSDQITRIVKLNYAAPAAIQGILTTYLTPVGKVQIHASTNSLVIWEQASNMGVLLELIKELDRKPAQVLIESNIVEITSEKDLNVGINWAASKASGGDPTINSSFNNPPTNAQGSPGAFSFGTIRSGFNINATLQALETHKKGKVISRPRIATATGVPAEINTTENVVIASTTSSIGLGGIVQTTTTFTNVPLPIDLKVTPRITDDGRITTVVNASITSQTGPAQGSGAPPPTSVQTATTTITTKNGETIVIGGLVRETTTDIVNGLPLLSSLPIIGTLFQEHEKSSQKVELVIFITPTLLED